MRTAACLLAMTALSGLSCIPAPDADGTDGVALGVDLSIPNEGAAHFPTGTRLSYQHNPPASGPHWPNPAARGFYDSAVAVEQWVHNLEHGYVVILYDCRGACDAQLLDALRAFVDAAPVSQLWGYAKIVVTPYDGLPEGVLITAVAWDVQMHLAAFDESALTAFVDRYQDQGPEQAP